MIFEICIDSVEGALAAQAAGAQRVELCDNLVEGGTTPSAGMVQTACRVADIAVNVIVRPRGGDFVYTDLEFDVMAADIKLAKSAGANGVVIGLLLPDGTVDVERTRRLVDLARPLSVTFHRAFDLSRDPAEALEAIISAGIDRLLTSGQRANAMDGHECIARMVNQAAGRTIVMAGGGVSAANIADVISHTGVSEVHFAARKTVPSPMTFYNPGCYMGKAYQPDEYILKVTDEGPIREIIQAAG